MQLGFQMVLQAVVEDYSLQILKDSRYNLPRRRDRLRLFLVMIPPYQPTHCLDSSLVSGIFDLL